MSPTQPPTTGPSMAPTVAPTVSPSESPTYPRTFRLESSDLVASYVGQGKCLDSAGQYYSNILVSSSDNISLNGCGQICTNDQQGALEAGLVGFALVLAPGTWYCVCYYNYDSPLPPHSPAFLSQDLGAGQVAASDGRLNHYCYAVALEVVA